MSKLSYKQERFCREYVIDFNGTHAAIRAGYSKNTASVQAARLLTKDKVIDKISELKKKAVEKIEITHQDVLNKLKNWVESDITEVVNLTPKEVKELPIDIRRLITKFKVRRFEYQDGTKREIVECEFVSKEKAIDMINRHIGFYEADNKQSQPVIEITRKIVDG